MYPTYVLDNTLRLNAGPDTPVINFAQLKAKLLSKDFYNVTLPQKVCLLDGEGKIDSVGLCSFPRTGNSFLRKYLEKVTGVATGSDQQQDI